MSKKGGIIRGLHPRLGRADRPLAIRDSWDQGPHAPGMLSFLFTSLWAALFLSGWLCPHSETVRSSYPQLNHQGEISCLSPIPVAKPPRNYLVALTRSGAFSYLWVLEIFRRKGEIIEAPSNPDSHRPLCAAMGRFLNFSEPCNMKKLEGVKNNTFFKELLIILYK